MRPVPVSAKLASLAESLTVAVDVKVKERLARGEDIVNLGVGQPDFPTPAAIREAAARAVEAGATVYTPPGGTPELRRAAAEYFQKWNDIAATPATTAVTCGAKHAIYEAMAAVLGPGDEVLLPIPYWVSYPEQVRLADARPVPVPASAALKVTPADLEARRTARTRLLVLNSPSNPSGAVYTGEEVAALVEWCARHEVLLLSDEIYDRLVYDGTRTVSPASLGPEAAARTITVNGVSKAYSMTGWRIGFVHGPPPVIDALIKFQGQTTGNPAAVSQAAALAAVTGPQDAVEAMRAAYEQRRRIAVEALRHVPGLTLVEPRGAFYVFPRVEAAVRAAGGSLALSARLVDQGVAVVPGDGFGADDHVRLSFAVGDDRLRVGLERFVAGINAISRSGS